MVVSLLSQLPYELIFKILGFISSYETLCVLSTIPEISEFVKNSTLVIRLSIDDGIEQENIKKFHSFSKGNSISNNICELKIAKEVFRNEDIKIYPLIIQDTNFVHFSKFQEISFVSVEIFATNEPNRWDQVFQFNILERLDINAILRYCDYKIRVLNIDLYVSKSMFVPYGYERLQRFHSKEDTFLYPGYYKLQPFPYLLEDSYGVDFNQSDKCLSFLSASCLSKNTRHLRRADYAIPKVPISSGFKYAYCSGGDWIEPSINIILSNRSYDLPLSPRESARGLKRSLFSEISTPQLSKDPETLENNFYQLLDKFNYSYYISYKSYILSKIRPKSLMKSQEDLILSEFVLPKPHTSQIMTQPLDHSQITEISRAYFSLFDIFYNKSQKDWRNQEVEFIKIKLYLDGVDTVNVIEQLERKNKLFLQEV